MHEKAIARARLLIQVHPLPLLTDHGFLENRHALVEQVKTKVVSKFVLKSRKYTLNITNNF